MEQEGGTENDVEISAVTSFSTFEQYRVVFEISGPGDIRLLCMGLYASLKP